MNRIAGDGETGAGDIFLAQVGQRFLKFPAPLRIAARRSLCRQASLPDAEEPDPIEADLGQSIEFSVWNVVQGRAPSQTAGEIGQPNASIDLVERRIADRLHPLLPFQRCVIYLRVTETL